MIRHAALALLVTLGLAACAAVPDKLPPPHLDRDAPLAGLPVDPGSHWPAATWWHRYDDAQLDALMRRAMNGSTSLEVARKRVAEAEQAAAITAASNGVKINGSAEITRKRLSEHGLIPTRFLGFTWYNQADLGVQLDYTFDWWGKHEASVQAALGKAHAARAQAAAAAIGLQSAVAQTYFAWQADQARLKLSERAIDAGKRRTRIAQVRTDAGLQPEDQLLQARAALAATRQQHAQLAGMALIHRATLAALVGTSPDGLGVLEPKPLPEPEAGLPQHAGLDLIARRPDVAASRWQVESALRQTDVARAAFLPDFSISALAGLSSIDLDKLLNASSRTFSLTPALHLPIFEGGLLKARYGATRAQLDTAIAIYNDSIVQAARDVSRHALTVQQLAGISREQDKQLDNTQALLDKQQMRHKRGLTNLDPVLEARLAVLRQRDAGIELRARALSADIELIHALGGGYQANVPRQDKHSAPATRNSGHE